VTARFRPEEYPQAEAIIPSIPLAPRFSAVGISFPLLEPNESTALTGMLLPIKNPCVLGIISVIFLARLKSLISLFSLFEEKVFF